MTDALGHLTTAAFMALHPEGSAASIVENGSLIVPPHLYMEARKVAMAVLEAMREIPNTWKPIETAPQDGTQIIVCFINSTLETKMTMARYIDGKWRCGICKTGEVILVPDPVKWSTAPTLPVLAPTHCEEIK